MELEQETNGGCFEILALIFSIVMVVAVLVVMM